MSTEGLTLRPATRADLDLILQWAAGEGWNPGPHDADAFWAADPHGFLLAELDGQVIGGGSVVKYDDRLGFMGLFIVKPEFRGRGLGREIWHRRRDHLRARLDPDHGAIGLDGVVAMQPFYARGGFQLLQSTTRHFGPVASSHAAEEALPDGVRLVPLLELPFEQVERFDRSHFGASRPGFLEAWLRAPGTFALGAVDEADGTLLAMGSRRPGRGEGYKLGPLFARDERVADALFRALTRDVGDANVYLDVPEWNPAAVTLTRRYGLVAQFTCGRMYLGTAPSLPWGEIYGVTSFELG